MILFLKFNYHFIVIYFCPQMYGIRTTPYWACSEINVIQPKCWPDKLNVKLSFNELSVFTDDVKCQMSNLKCLFIVVFNNFHSSMKSNARAIVVAAKQQHRIQCDCPMI